MSVLDHATFFGGIDNFSGNELGHLEVANFENDVDTALSNHFAWRGKVTAAIGLALSPDNLRVDWGMFLLRGDMELKDKKMAANHIWAGANKDIVVTIMFPKADVFKFNDGGLWSDPVDASQVPHSFYDSTEGRGARALVATDDRLAGTEAGFCIRAVGQISSLSSASRGVTLRVAIMLYPSSMTDMGEIVHSKSPGWPGLKIGEVFAPLYPRPTAPWCCPVLPFIKPTQQFEEDDVMPTSDKLREAIFGIMRSAKIHEGLKCGQDVLNKWAQINTNPRLMMDKTPSITWPELAAPRNEDTSGKSNFVIVFTKS